MTPGRSDAGRVVLGVVGGEPSVLDLCQLLERSGLQVIQSAPTSAATELLRHRPDVVLMDVSPDHREPTMRVVDDLRRRERRLPIILVGIDVSAAVVVRALRAGAKNFFALPFAPDEVAAAVRSCVRDAAPRLAGGHAPSKRAPTLIGSSAGSQAVSSLIAAFATHDSTVLVTGETGTGKELVAQSIHAQSHRRAKPFATVSCPAVPDTLLESELFGYARGAFTGASGPNQGRLAAAAGGTVFFDEIGDMSLSAQAKILGAIESRQVCRLGDHHPVALDVRFIAATNADLEGMLADGRFRRDLYYRLNVAHVHLPPLRERQEDIAPLLEHYAQHFSGIYRRDLRFADDTLERLAAYDWPGNIRELRNLVEALFASGHDGLVTIHDLSTRFDRLLRTPDDAERQRVLAVIRACNWNKSRAARQLQWSRMTLYRWLNRYQIPLSGRDAARGARQV